MPMRTNRCSDGDPADCCEHQDNCTPAEVTPDPCAALLACLATMYAVVHLEFADDENCDWSVMNGDYTFEPDGLGGWDALFPTDILARKAAAEGCLDLDGNINCINKLAFSPIVTCLGESMLITLDSKAANLDFDNCEATPVAYASDEFPLPVTISNGTMFDLTEFIDGAAFYAGSPNPTVASVTFYGRPCSTDPCATGPTAGFTADNIVVDGGIDSCTNPPEPADLYTGCTYTITDNATAGACPIDKIFWSNGVEGADPGTLTISDECGPTEDYELTQIVIDERGCIDTHTETLSCCNCCTPSGSVTIEDDAFADYYEDEVLIYAGGTGCGPPFGDVSCTLSSKLHCYYLLTFGAGTVTDCEGTGPEVNEVEYIVDDWDGITDENGDPLPIGCYYASDVLHLRYNHGNDNQQDGCLRIRVTDKIGCEGEEIVIDFRGADTKTSPSPECEFLEDICEET